MSKDNSPIEQLQNQNLIVFDGECVLCSSFFNFIVRADTQKQFNFAIAQSDFGERLGGFFTAMRLLLDWSVFQFAK